MLRVLPTTSLNQISHPLENSYSVSTVAFYLGTNDKSTFSLTSTKINTQMKIIIENDLECKNQKVDYEIKMMNPNKMGLNIEKNFSRLQDAENKLKILLGPSSLLPWKFYSQDCCSEYLVDRTKYFTWPGRQLLKEAKGQNSFMRDVKEVKTLLDAQTPDLREDIMDYPKRRTRKQITCAVTVTASAGMTSACFGNFCLPVAITTPVALTCSAVTVLLSGIRHGIGKIIPAPECVFSYEDVLSQARNELKRIEELSGIAELNNLLLQSEILKSQLELAHLKAQRKDELNKMVLEKNKTGGSVKNLIGFFNQSGYPRLREESKEMKRSFRK